MKDFIKYKILQNWGWIVIILLLCSVLASKCTNEKQDNHDSVVSKTVSSKKEALNVIHVPETIVKKFVKIKTITKYVDRIKIDTIKVVYTDSVPCVFEKKGTIVEKDFSLDYVSNQHGFTGSNLNIIDTVYHISGMKRKWFWGKETLTVDISHSNKAVNSGEIKHVEIKPKKKFYDTTVFKVGLGFVAGVLILK